jgi:hypothetical protein
MKKQSIKSHLAPYLILPKRKTTVNHAFASAIAPVDEYDEERLGAALRSLGQDPESDLSCVFCGLPAETWDHLVGLVENGELRGYGHQLGNLVPCCRICNFRKGGKDWDVYLQEVVPDQSIFEEKYRLIASYRDQYAAPVDLKRAAEMLPEDSARYAELKNEIFRLMAQADTIAVRLRAVVVVRQA